MGFLNCIQASSWNGPNFFGLELPRAFRFELELFNLSGRAGLSLIEPTGFLLISLCIMIVFRLGGFKKAWLGNLKLGMGSIG